MNGILIKRINNSGLKKKHIAERLNVQPSTLSMWISGDRAIPVDKEILLKQLLEKVA